jgi:dCTP deaminase
MPSLSSCLDIFMGGTILCDTELAELFTSGVLQQPNSSEHIQPASLDLCCAEGTIWEVAGIPNLTEHFSIDTFTRQYGKQQLQLGRQPLLLERDTTYLVPLSLSLALPEHLFAVANPKSSTGRIDVHVTVIGDGEREFNTLRHGYYGPLYLLVVPQSFPIQLRSGDSLAQLRVISQQRTYLAGDTELKRLHLTSNLVHGVQRPFFSKEGLVLHLDLAGTPSNLLSKPGNIVVDLAVRKQLAAADYFAEKPLDHWGNLILNPGEFAIATTIERLSIPPAYSAEMIPFDERQGELRTHYAGFFDPGFGTASGQGGAVVCEIRNIGRAPAILSHGQPICLFRFEALRKLPASQYGNTGAKEASNYAGQQAVTLAKYFTSWKEKEAEEPTQPKIKTSEKPKDPAPEALDLPPNNLGSIPQPKVIIREQRRATSG